MSEDEKSYKTKHEGWFYGCPVYIYDAYSEGPGLEPRHWTLIPLFWLSENFGGTVMFLASLLGAEPAWMIGIGKRLE
jgi:hypothetical protein